jgi:hypothetical protein
MGLLMWEDKIATGFMCWGWVNDFVDGGSRKEGEGGEGK